jgi:CTP:molybdopterin cytidylyltransferase MocA
MVFLMSDLDLPVRDRTYREPPGPHVAVVRGRDLTHALDHLSARPDCRALGVIGAPESIPGLSVLGGHRVLVVDADGARMRDFAQACLDVKAEVEWMHAERPSFERVAEWALPVGAVILAAGQASRMGSNKLLLDAGGKPLVRHVVEAASEGGCHFVTVVYADAAVREAVGDSATTIFNPDAATGMASSLRAGLEAQPEEVAGALMMLGDQPLVGARTVEMLVRNWRREGARPALAAAYGDQRSQWRPPVVIDRTLWPELKALDGDAGARQLFDRQPELLDTVLAAGRPDDVDTPEDYAKIVRLFPTKPR